MSKLAKNLAKDINKGYEKEDYYNIIVESFVAGRKQQCKDQFNKMKRESQVDFINNYLQISTHEYHRKIMRSCVEELAAHGTR